MISTRQSIAKQIRRLEKKLIPTLRNNKNYRLVMRILLLPVAFTTYWLDKLIALLYKNKPTDSNKRHKINFSNIVSGFTNLAFPNEEVEKIAKVRADICAGCPFATKTGVYSVVRDNRTVTIQGMKCDKCGCNLSAKVRSVHDRCPVGKW